MAGKKRMRRDRREEILQEATKLFSTYGFRGTSLSQVADGVGLTEPGLLHYFSSKVELLQAVLEYRDREDVKKYTAMVDPDTADLAEAMEALQDLVAENAKVPELIRLFTVLVSESIWEDHPSHDFFVDRYARVRQDLAEMFARLTETGRSAPDRESQLAPIVIAVMDGLQIQWLLDPVNTDMSAAFELFSRMVLEYCREQV